MTDGLKIRTVDPPGKIGLTLVHFHNLIFFIPASKQGTTKIPAVS